MLFTKETAPSWTEALTVAFQQEGEVPYIGHGGLPGHWHIGVQFADGQGFFLRGEGYLTEIVTQTRLPSCKTPKRVVSAILAHRSRR